MSSNTNKNIALDADGVMLYYPSAFSKIWQEYYGEEPLDNGPHFSLKNHFSVEIPKKPHPLWDLFDQKGWKSMDAIPGSVEACHWLKDQGFNLICVSALPKHRDKHRLDNLRKLGFPIERVIATGVTSKDSNVKNPKKYAVESISPAYFVDDIHRFLDGINGCKKVLIDRDLPDSPNRTAKIKSNIEIHSSLYAWTSSLKRELGVHKCIAKNMK